MSDVLGWGLLGGLLLYGAWGSTRDVLTAMRNPRPREGNYWTSKPFDAYGQTITWTTPARFWPLLFGVLVGFIAIVWMIGSMANPWTGIIAAVGALWLTRRWVADKVERDGEF